MAGAEAAKVLDVIVSCVLCGLLGHKQGKQPTSPHKIDLPNDSPTKFLHGLRGIRRRAGSLGDGL